ncbi:MAG TPA: cytochrome C oxidase subunit I [Burkholderiales bacterium]|nr:cytochrome C oxidase subunit I [Burkholderiales bacterium]
MSNASRKSRIELWLILAFCTAPVVAAYVVFYWWQPQQGTMNYGELLPVKPLPDSTLQLVDGRAFHISELRRKWVLLQVDSGTCDENCRHKLYTLRQVRLTQGKDMQRIERAWVIDDNSAPSPQLLQEYSGTWLIRGAGSALLKALPAPGSARDHIYVVDPLGNLMLRFPPDADPRKMVKDITRLLKVSRIG